MKNKFAEPLWTEEPMCDIIFLNKDLRITVTSEKGGGEITLDKRREPTKENALDYETLCDWRVNPYISNKFYILIEDMDFDWSGVADIEDIIDAALNLVIVISERDATMKNMCLEIDKHNYSI